MAESRNKQGQSYNCLVLLFVFCLCMDLDDELCLCFHVNKRKVLNFLEREKPKRASQMSECFGAGTGCGWCRPYLRKLFEAAQHGGQATQADLPDACEYA